MNALESIAYLFKPLLYPFSLLYGLIIWLRNKAYDQKIFSSIAFDLPVITVGNLNTGGTGKTPTVEYLLRLFQYHYQVATMSRGYKRKSKGFKIADHKSNAYTIGDEPMQYVIKYPEAIVSVSEDRLTGIPYLLRQRPEIDVILLDDAFQHRSVQAGLNILITDYAAPYYKDFILPFGRLREPRSAAARADIIIVSKCPPNLSIEQQKEMTTQLRPLDKQHVFFSYISYQMPRTFFDQLPFPLDNKMGIILVSGIANPTSIMSFLQQEVDFVHLLKYPDHHYFSTKDVEEIKAAYQNLDYKNKAIILTEKDSVRLALHKDILLSWEVPILILPIEIKFINNGDRFDQLVMQYVRNTILEREQY